MDGPLVFLTSTSDSVPSGRNARAVARASMVRQTQCESARSTAARGSFNVFPATRHQSRKKAYPKSTPLEQSAYASAWGILMQQQQQQQQRPTAAGNIPRPLGPQSIVIAELLSTARGRIKRDLASTLMKQPSRVRDALRCRQWALASFASGTLRLTPEVHSAVEYLEHKLLSTSQSQPPHALELQKYGVALVELQHSLRDAERRMQPSILAASHILAVCEMLDDATSGSYLKFVDGIVMLSNLHACRGDYYARSHVHARAGALWVEALLTRRDDARFDEPWSQTLAAAGDKGHISPEDAFSFSNSAALIFSGPSWTHMAVSKPVTKTERIAVAAKARRLHSSIKTTIQVNLKHSDTKEYACSNTELLSERLAVMLGLEDFISHVANECEDSLVPVHNNDYGFYADAICAM